MRRPFILLIAALSGLLLLAGCGLAEGQSSDMPASEPTTLETTPSTHVETTTALADEETQKSKLMEREPGVYHRISAEEGRQMLEQGDAALLLDVRTRSENEARRIPGDFNLPVEQLRERLDELPASHDTPIVIYCRSGNRSAAAANILLEAGFLHVHDMGGLSDWPYETESGPRP